MEKVYCSECGSFVVQEGATGLMKGCSAESKMTLVEDWHSSRRLFSDPAVNNAKNDCDSFVQRIVPVEEVQG